MVHKIILRDENGKKTGYKYIQFLPDGTKKEYFAKYKARQPVFEDLVREIDPEAKLERKKVEGELSMIKLEGKLTPRKY